MDFVKTLVDFREFKEREDTRWSASQKCKPELEKSKTISFETQSSASIVSSSDVELRLKYKEDSSVVTDTKPMPVLFGGGPSSIAPLAEALLLQKEKRLVGNPECSLTLRGRDAQKTVSSLVTVASKYKTFDKLLETTGLYYRYLVEVSNTFELELSEAVEVIYQGETFDGCKLFYSEQQNSFLKGFVVSKSQIKVDNLDYELNGSVYTLSAKSQENIRSQDSTAISVCGVKYKVKDLLSMTLSDLSSTHGELHYLSLLFNGWEEIEHFEETSTKGCVVNGTDRGSFSYSRDVDVLLAEMNVRFCRVAHRMLSLNQNVEKLSPLQENLFHLLKKYLERYNHVPKFLDDEAFVIVGAGRAAGELSRRLTKDVIHSNSLGKIETALKVNSSGDLIQKVLEDMKLKELKELNFKPKRRRIAVIDHRRSRKVEDILTSVSFKDFLTEITKFDIYPHMDSTAFSHYKKLYEFCLKMAEPENKSVRKVVLSIQKSLKNLLENSPQNGYESYKLVLLDSYNPKLWTKNEVEVISSFVTGRKSSDLSSLNEYLWIVGGAQHVLEGCDDLIVPSTYQLKRIHDSHYRKENLEFVTSVGKQLISQAIEKPKNNL